jgi:dynein assembly factor 2
MAFAAPTKLTLQKAFKQTFLNSKSRDSLNLSDSEVNQLGNAFEDDQFTTLLSDYIQEISDPKNKAEKDLYLKQLEKQNDVPENKVVIHPKAGYVLKFKSRNGDKIFANIVHSEEIAKPSSQTIEGKRGTHWSLPYIIGPMRYEFDKKKRETITFDICFHSYTLRLGHSSKDLRDLIAATAKEAVGEQLCRNVEKVEIEAEFHVLKNVPYMNGSPSIMLLSNDKLKTLLKHNDNNIEMKETLTGIQTSKEFGLKKGFLLGNKKRNEIDSSSKSILVSSEPIIPHYEVIERGKFDLIDHTMDGRTHKSTRPAFIEYRISLPTIKSSNQIDLKVSRQCIELSTSSKATKCTKYAVNIPLHYPILSEEGTAKFDTSLSKLVITLPVERQENSIQTLNTNTSDTKQLLVEVKNTQYDLHSCKMNSSDFKSSPEDKCSDTHSRWLESNSDDCSIIREHFATKDKIPVKTNEDKANTVHGPDQDMGAKCLKDIELNEVEKVECSDISGSKVTEQPPILLEQPLDSKMSLYDIVFELD